MFAFKPREFNYLKYVARNYLRYTLPILASIGLIYMVPLFGSGPLWHLFDETLTDNCRTNVWATLLFYSNLNDSYENTVRLRKVYGTLN